MKTHWLVISSISGILLFFVIAPWIILGIATSYDKAEEWYCGTKGLLPSKDGGSPTQCGSPLPEYPKE